MTSKSEKGNSILNRTPDEEMRLWERYHNQQKLIKTAEDTGWYFEPATNLQGEFLILLDKGEGPLPEYLSSHPEIILCSGLSPIPADSGPVSVFKYEMSAKNEQQQEGQEPERNEFHEALKNRAEDEWKELERARLNNVAKQKALEDLWKFDELWKLITRRELEKERLRKADEKEEEKLMLQRRMEEEKKRKEETVTRLKKIPEVSIEQDESDSLPETWEESDLMFADLQTRKDKIDRDIKKWETYLWVNDTDIERYKKGVVAKEETQEFISTTSLQQGSSSGKDDDEDTDSLDEVDVDEDALDYFSPVSGDESLSVTYNQVELPVETQGVWLKPRKK